MIAMTNQVDRVKADFIPKFAAHQIHIDLISHSASPSPEYPPANITSQIKSRLDDHPIPFFDVLASQQLAYTERHALLYDLLGYGPKKGLIHSIQEEHGHETHRIREMSHPDGSAYIRILFDLDVYIMKVDLRLAVSDEYKAKLQYYGIEYDFVQISHLELDELPWSVASTMTQYFACRGSMLQHFRAANTMHPVRPRPLCWKGLQGGLLAGPIPRSVNMVAHGNDPIMPSLKEHIENLLLNLLLYC